MYTVDNNRHQVLYPRNFVISFPSCDGEEFKDGWKVYGRKSGVKQGKKVALKEGTTEKRGSRVGGFPRTAKPPTRGADSETARRPESTAFAL